jgi:hypothetical protein
VNPLLAGVVCAVGVASLALGVWTAVNARRPSWLTLKPIAQSTARAWGLATSVSGLGLTVLGANFLGPSNRLIALFGFGLLVLGAGWVVLASPASRRPR